MQLDQVIARIGIPPRTPLSAVFRYPTSWLVWIGVRDMQQPYSKWEGTYLQLHDDGRVTRVTVYEDGTEEQMEIKG